jgi:hypothetical protein
MQKITSFRLCAKPQKRRKEKEKTKQCQSISIIIATTVTIVHGGSWQTQQRLHFVTRHQASKLSPSLTYPLGGIL